METVIDACYIVQLCLIHNKNFSGPNRSDYHIYYKLLWKISWNPINEYLIHQLMLITSPLCDVHINIYQITYVVYIIASISHKVMGVIIQVIQWWYYASNDYMTRLNCNNRHLKFTQLCFAVWLTHSERCAKLVNPCVSFLHVS